MSATAAQITLIAKLQAETAWIADQDVTANAAVASEIAERALVEHLQAVRADRTGGLDADTVAYLRAADERIPALPADADADTKAAARAARRPIMVAEARAYGERAAAIYRTAHAARVAALTVAPAALTATEASALIDTLTGK